MKQLLLVFLITLAAATVASAQRRAEANKGVEEEIRRLDIAAAKAILQKDEKAIAKFFTADSVTNNPRNELTLGSTGVIEAARTNLIDYHSFERAIESLKVRGNTAIVMGNETVVLKGRDGGAGQTIRRRYTNIWMKIGSSWQIVGRHASVICP